MAETRDFHYEADTTHPLSSEVVTAIAKAHDEDVLDQKWRISDDINTDALDGLFQDHQLDTTLQFEADTVTVTIRADRDGNPSIKIESHR
ncbi:HalOD1 output domain-containing protein [Haloarcula sp. GH36]|uniref:HalOD1 output domain-containing protein n=1 Tax=Haloarcula montana TaxID=3111776 RepID=UPI002D76D436|nr:HalOD1 output domain-containing protein [Haloarcula sp. GH36]